jgi:DNA-nicking Smr family endonuclease
MAAAIMRGGEGKPGRRGLSAEERKLWGQVTRSVAPLRRRPLLVDAAQPAAPGKPKSLSAPTRSALAVTRAAPSLEPFDRRLKQRLARGTESIDGRIDLHGKTQSEAHAALLAFLRNAQREGIAFALVITGKGGSARDGWSERGVLRRQVPEWLRLPEFRGYVVGFEDAHTRHGGAGALYVRIRRRRSGARTRPDS